MIRIIFLIAFLIASKMIRHGDKAVLVKYVRLRYLYAAFQDDSDNRRIITA